MRNTCHEAITTLQECCNRPHLLHQAHMHTIVETPSLKDDDGRELCHLYDILMQHLLVLKVIEYEPSLFVVSLIEMKLDQTTTFEWQRQTQGSSKMPHRNELLNLLDDELEPWSPLPVRYKAFSTKHASLRNYAAKMCLSGQCGQFLQCVWRDHTTLIHTHAGS